MGKCMAKASTGALLKTASSWMQVAAGSCQSHHCVCDAYMMFMYAEGQCTTELSGSLT